MACKSSASVNSDAGTGQGLKAKRAETAAKLSASQKNKEKNAQAGFFRSIPLRQNLTENEETARRAALIYTIITHQTHGVFLKIKEPIIQLPRIEIYCPEILIGIKALITGPI
jgi:hypothetical protein